MDIVQTKSIKVPNAVIVSGIAGVEQDNDVFDYLKKYGSIAQIIMVDDRTSEFFQSVIVEYNTGLAVEDLEPLPRPYVSDSGSSYQIQSLADVYAKSVGNSTTKSYLTELKNLAKMSGRDYGGVLKDMMSQIHESIKELVDISEQTDVTDNLPESPLVEPQPSAIDSNTKETQQKPGNPPRAVLSSSAHSLPSISAHNLNPPEVQRMVVEHIVKREDFTAQQSSQRLRAFSGKDPRPSYEPDYDTWRSGVELIMTDPSISELQKSRKILESLLPPAADIVRHLSPTCLPTEYLEMLESAYGAVQDGGELYAKFLDTFQNPGEKPSAFLQRLQVALTLTVKRGGALSHDLDRLLLTQFCRGCWDNSLLTDLQLKQKRSSPPTFSELLLLLRIEEDQTAAKTMRMRQHLGATKQKATTYVQSAKCHADDENNLVTLSTITKELAKQVVEIQSQLAKLNAKPPKPEFQNSKNVPTATKPKEKWKPDKVNKGPTEQIVKTQSSRPKPWYCFQCGEDGHIKPHCENEPNPELVTEKRKLLREKQRKWEVDNPTAANEQLNYRQSLLRGEWRL